MGFFLPFDVQYSEILFAQLVPVEVRHSYVEKQHVEVKLRKQLERLVAFVGNLDYKLGRRTPTFERVGFQKRFFHLQSVRLVVGDQGAHAFVLLRLDVPSVAGPLAVGVGGDVFEQAGLLVAAEALVA